MATKNKGRGDGEGSIYLRSDGRWAASVSLGWTPKGRNRKTIYGKTRSEVAKKLVELQGIVQNGKSVSKDNVTVRKLMDDFLAAKKDQVRATTFRLYEQMVRVHIIPGLGGMKVSQLDARQIDSFLRQCRSAKLDAEGKPKTLSAYTINQIRGILRTALNDAIEWEIVSKNVAEKSKPAKVEKRDVPILTPEQAQVLLDTFGEHRYRPMFTVMLGLGIRLGEARGLRWTDVKFDNSGGGTVTIRSQMQRLPVSEDNVPGDIAPSKKKTYVLTAPKSRSSHRTIPLPAIVAEALKKQKVLQLEWEQLAGNRWRNEHDLVFTNFDGGVVDDARLRQHFGKLVEDAGFPKMRLHDLRHACASLLISQNVPMHIVQAILGHSSITLTMNTYVHLMPTATQMAADAMHNAIARRS